MAVYLGRRLEPLRADEFPHRHLVVVAWRLEGDVVDSTVALPPAVDCRQHVDVRPDRPRRGEAGPLVTGGVALCLFGPLAFQSHSLQ